MVDAALKRELAGFEMEGRVHEPRMPLGLVLLAKGWITHAQLKGALDQQREAGYGSIGEWLRDIYGVSNETIAKGLPAQWNCTYLRSDHSGIRTAPEILPDIVREKFDLLPVFHTASGIAYLVSPLHVEPSVLAATGRMLGLRIEAAFMAESVFRRNQAPRTSTIRTTCFADRTDFCVSLVRTVEKAMPLACRMLRIRDLIWLRMWKYDPTEIDGRANQPTDYFFPIEKSAARISFGSMTPGLK